MAKTWERCLAKLEYPSRRLALFLLHELTDTYLRGYGVRLGSYQSLERHGIKVTLLHAAVVVYVLEVESRDLWFPHVSKLFPEAKAVTDTMMSELMELSREEETTGE